MQRLYVAHCYSYYCICSHRFLVGFNQSLAVCCQCTQKCVGITS